MSLFFPFMLLGAAQPGADRGLSCEVTLNPGSTAAGGKTLWIKSDNTIRLSRLEDAATGAIETGATISLTLVDGMGVSVPGVAWPLSAVESTAKPGTYDLVIPSAAQMTDGRTYTPRMTVVTADTGGTLYLEDPYVARTYAGERR